MSNTNFVQTVCCQCKSLIDIRHHYNINGVACCWYCQEDHHISRNPCRKPYKEPRSRKFISRTRLTDIDWAYTTTMACTQASGGPGGSISGNSVTQEQVDNYIKNPVNGL